MSENNTFELKDSGQRKEFDSGMKRDVDENKVGYHLVFDGPMFERWAIHMTKGAKKYSEGNWLKANGPEEMARFRKSAIRHFIQWFRGDRDEDHAAAVFFNCNGFEYVRDRLPKQTEDKTPPPGLKGLLGEKSPSGIPGPVVKTGMPEKGAVGSCAQSPCVCHQT